MIPVKSPTWRGTAVVALVPLLIFAAAIQHEQVWQWMGIGRLLPPYADLVAILAAGEASRAGLDVYAVPNPFDPYGRPHVYGPWWLATGRLGLEVSDAWWIGTILLIAFVAAAACLLAPCGRRASAWSAAFLGSPAIMLGLERGNNDLLIFLLLALAAWLLTRAFRGAAGLATGVVAFAAGLKIYPIAAAGILIAHPKRWRSILIAVTFGALGWLVFGANWSEGFRQGIAAAPEPETIFAHGLRVGRYTWEVLAPARLWILVGGGLAIAVVAALVRSDWRRLWCAVPCGPGEGVYFAAGALPWLLCFVLTSNFPYRLVLLLLPARLWLVQVRDASHGRLPRLQLGLWLGAAWLLMPKYWAVVWLKSDEASALKWVGMIAGLEQALMAMLTLLLGWSVTGWLCRSVHAFTWPGRKADKISVG